MHAKEKVKGQTSRLGAARAAPRGTGRFGAWWGCAYYLCLLHNCVYSSELREVYTKEWISLYVNCVLIFNKEKNVAIAGGKNVLTRNKPD